MFGHIVLFLLFFSSTLNADYISPAERKLRATAKDIEQYSMERLKTIIKIPDHLDVTDKKTLQSFFEDKILPIINSKPLLDKLFDNTDVDNITLFLDALNPFLFLIKAGYRTDISKMTKTDRFNLAITISEDEEWLDEFYKVLFTHKYDSVGTVLSALKKDKTPYDLDAALLAQKQVYRDLPKDGSYRKIPEKLKKIIAKYHTFKKSDPGTVDSRIGLLKEIYDISSSLLKTEISDDEREELLSINERAKLKYLYLSRLKDLKKESSFYRNSLSSDGTHEILRLAGQYYGRSYDYDSIDPACRIGLDELEKKWLLEIGKSPEADADYLRTIFHTFYFWLENYDDQNFKIGSPEMCVPGTKELIFKDGVAYSQRFRSANAQEFALIKGKVFFKIPLAKETDDIHYVIDHKGHLYIESTSTHDHVVTSRNIVSAGFIKLSPPGKLSYIDNFSGHYKPPKEMFLKAIELLKKQYVGQKIFTESPIIKFHHQ